MYSGIYLNIKYDNTVDLVGTYDPFNKSNYFYTGEIPDSNFLLWQEESGILLKDEQRRIDFNLDAIRTVRNKILNDTDWISIKFSETSEIPDEWKNFRQKLRDLPAQYMESGKLDINISQVSGIYFNEKLLHLEDSLQK